MPPPHDGAVTVDVPLRPDELLGAWRPDSRLLVLRTREPLRLKQRVAARITVGPGAAATVTGRVESASRHGDAWRIELAPDETRLRAVERLVAVARGEAFEDAARVPRLLATLPAVVAGPGGPTFMTTFAISDLGCGLTWSGPVPPVGATVALRVGAGARATSFRGEVRWTGRSGRAATVGIRFVSGPMHAWASILAEVRRSGAPPA